MNRMEVYFDNAASTKTDKEVISLMQKTLYEDYANPSAKHIKGVQAENYVKEAGRIIAKTLKADEKEIIFTSGGTESNNMALIGSAYANKRRGKHIIISAIEHPSVYEPALFLEKEGFEISILPVDKYGHIDKEELRNILRKDTVLVSVMYVNNEIGSVADIKGISNIIKNYNKDIIFHVDAIQAYAKFKINPKKEGIDLLSASAHKFHGPKGIGFLYANSCIKISPVLYGGGQQKGRRSGTLNVTGIAGLGLAAKLAYENLDENVIRMNKIKNFIIDNLSKEEGISFNSYKDGMSAPHIVSISVKGVRSEVLLHTLEEDGIYVASGSACSSNHPGISGTLKGINLDKNLLDSTIRISLSHENSLEEAKYFVERLKERVKALRLFIRK